MSDSNIIMKLIYPILSYYFLTSIPFAQDYIQTPETKIHHSKFVIQNHFSLSFSQSFYLNTNLPNLENQNGNYFPKGYGSISSLLFQYHAKYLSFSTEPVIMGKNQYSIILPEKDQLFSVLNDVPMGSNYHPNQFRNTGLQFHLMDYLPD